MKIDGNTIKVGNILNYEGRLWSVLKTQHTQPGKGGAYMQVEMKTLQGSTKTNVRFRSSEQVEKVSLEERPYQYLYVDGDQVVFMDQKNYEQINIPMEIVGNSFDFLKDEMIVSIKFYEETPLDVLLPDNVVLKIQEAEPVVKGQTASSSFKPAILENGVKIMVPQHIGSGMDVVVNVIDRTYVERAK